MELLGDYFDLDGAGKSLLYSHPLPEVGNQVV